MKTKIFKTMKALGMGAILVVASFGLIGCTEEPTEITYNQTQIDDMIIAQELATAKLINETSAEYLAELEAKQLEIDTLHNDIAKEVINETEEEVDTAYYIDEVSLNGDFSEVIDSDDFESLLFDTVEYDDEDYDVEEILRINSGVLPVYNIEDFGSEIFLSLDEGSLSYTVEFDECVDFSEDDEDEDLELSFLGEDVVISEIDNDEVTFYQGEEFTMSEAESAFYQGYTVELTAVSDDDKAYIKVVDNGYSESRTVRVGETEEINGLEVYVKETFDSDNNAGFATIRIGTDEVELDIEDGDEYDADDRFEWVINSEDDKLCSIGLVLTEEYNDDEDLLSLGESLCLPGDFLCVSLDDVKFEANEDVEITLTSSDKVKLNYDGKIELNDKRVEDIVFDLEDGVVEYETYSGDDEEMDIDDANIILFNDDRELVFEVSSDTVSLGGYDIVFEDGDFQKESLRDVGFDDEDDKILINGDLLYSVDDDFEDVDSIKFGLVGEDDIEVTLKVD